MTTTTKNLEVKIYCGTYGNYNNGNLFGAWIDLTDMDKEEFYLACEELHQNEVDPEFMFQDFESSSDALKSMIDEGGIDKDFWSLKEALKDFTEEQLEAFDIYSNNTKDFSISNFEENFFCYIDSFDINQAFGEYFAETTGEILEMPQHLQYYFDYESYGRDLLINDFWEDGGYIFGNR